MSENNSQDIYDVAISFLGQDEEIAKQLYESLEQRLDVFYYAERQPELVGTDGEESFSRVFRDNSNVVVVLYRDGWGETMMTRAERSGIKQRASNEGYSFSIWVPLDEEKSVPAFLDPQFIWFDYDRWGIDGLCAVVEEKVKESGKKVRPENTFDRLNKIKDKAELEKARNSFYWSEEGVQFVKDSQRELKILIEERIEKYQEITNDVRFAIDNSGQHIGVNSHPYRIVFYIFNEASNMIRDDRMVVDIQKNINANHPVKNYSDYKSYEFKPTLDESGSPAWKLINGGFYSLQEAINMILDELAELSYEEWSKNIQN